MMEDKSDKNECNIGHRTIFHKYTNCKEDEMKKLLKRYFYLFLPLTLFERH